MTEFAASAHRVPPVLLREVGSIPWVHYLPNHLVLLALTAQIPTIFPEAPKSIDTFAIPTFQKSKHGMPYLTPRT
jgi:hypothetical protein